MHDAVIVGAGVAGLSAALWLGRCRRDTLVFDSGKPRNAVSRGLHGFLTRDGVTPHLLRLEARREIGRYPSVTLRDLTIRKARRIPGGFEVEAEDGSVARTRLLLLATGRVDPLPPLPGIREFYGRGVYHCAYCDGWEHRDEPLAVYGANESALGVAELLSTWSRDVVVCTDGAAMSLEPGNSVALVTTKIVRLEGDDRGMLAKVHFEDGTARRCRGIFFCSDCDQRSHLPESLGCAFDADGSVVCEGHAATKVPGLYVAGNVRGGIHLAIMAAAEGAEAALAMNEALLRPAEVQAG